MAARIVPFTPTMLPEAGALLAVRQKRLREVRHELPLSFEEPATAAAAVEAAWQRDDASGTAALDDGRLVGYLIGDLVLNNLWGRSAWVRFAGCSLAPDQDVELVRDLYAALAAPWVRMGCFNLFAVMPATEPALLNMWYALCFGIEQAHGLVAMDALDLSPRPDPPGVEIRRVGPADRALMEDVSDIVWRHLVQAPIWGIHLPERQALHRGEYGDLVEDPEMALWLAFYQGKLAGYSGYSPVAVDSGNPLVPQRCAELGPAGTRDWARGRGIGQALTHHVFSHIRSSGFHYCLTDWRSTNLTASRF